MLPVCHAVWLRVPLACLPSLQHHRIDLWQCRPFYCRLDLHGDARPMQAVSALLTPFSPAPSASWPAHRTQRRHQLARPGSLDQTRHTQSLTCRCPVAGNAQPAQPPSPASLPTASTMSAALRTAASMAQHTMRQSRPLSHQAPLARTPPFPSRRVLTTDCLPAELPPSL